MNSAQIGQVKIMQVHLFHCCPYIVLCSFYSGSQLACSMRFILLLSLTNRQKTLTFTCQFQEGGGRGQRQANVGSDWGEKSRCHCRRLPSLCIWRTQLLHRQTEPDEYINTNKLGGRGDLPGIELVSHFHILSERERMLVSLGHGH